MAWAGSYRAAPASTIFSTSVSTYAVNKATGTVAGDLILLYVAPGVGNGPFTCPGFAAFSASGGAQILARTADGTEGSTFTVTNTGAASRASFIQATIAGPCSIDVVGAANSGLTANPAATGLTVAGSNELLMWFGSAEVNSTGVGIAVATAMPTGFTSQVTGTSGTSFVEDTLLCDNGSVASGATGTVSATNASVLNTWAAQMVAIQPLARPQYRATPTIYQSANNTSSSWSVTKQAGVVSGDLILLSVFFAGNGNGDAAFSCTGFTPGTTVYNGASYDIGYQLLWKIADGMEGSTFSVTASDVAGVTIGQVVVAGSLIDVQGTSFAPSSTSTAPAVTGVTVANSNELLLWVAGGIVSSSGNGIAPGLPGGVVSRAVSGYGASHRLDINIADISTVPSGASGTLTGSFGAATFWAGQQIAVKVSPSTSVTVAGPVATSASAALAGTVSISVPGAVATETGAALAGGVRSGVGGQVATSAGVALAGGVGTGVGGQVATSTGAALAGAIDIGEVVVGVTATAVSAALPGAINTDWTVPGAIAAATGVALAGGIGITVPGAVATESSVALAGVTYVDTAGQVAAGAGVALAGGVGAGAGGPVAAGTGLALAGGVGAGTDGVTATAADVALPGAVVTDQIMAGPVATSSGAALAGTMSLTAPGVVAQSAGVALPGTVAFGWVVAGPVATSVAAALAGHAFGGAFILGPSALEVSLALAGAISTGWTTPGQIAQAMGDALPGGIYASDSYIENFCPNPTFEVDLTGYTALTNSAIELSRAGAAYGRQSMQVTTDGLAAGEGASTPGAMYFTETIRGSAGVALSGDTGTVVVSAYSNPGGVLLGSVTAVLTPEWQRYILNDLSLFGGDEIYLTITTPFAQSLAFLVDAVQYEENSPASMYIDGDQTGARWVSV